MIGSDFRPCQAWASGPRKLMKISAEFGRMVPAWSGEIDEPMAKSKP
jgi:hypothetical protein